MPKAAKYKKDDSCIIYLHNPNTKYPSMYILYNKRFLSFFQDNIKQSIILNFKETSPSQLGVCDNQLGG